MRTRSHPEGDSSGARSRDCTYLTSIAFSGADISGLASAAFHCGRGGRVRYTLDRVQHTVNRVQHTRASAGHTCLGMLVTPKAVLDTPKGVLGKPGLHVLDQHCFQRRRHLWTGQRCLPLNAGARGGRVQCSELSVLGVGCRISSRHFWTGERCLPLRAGAGRVRDYCLDLSVLSLRCRVKSRHFWTGERCAPLQGVRLQCLRFSVEFCIECLLFSFSVWGVGLSAAC